MKIRLLVCYLSLLICVSCERSYLAYDVFLKDGIYFASEDSLTYTFGLETRDTVPYSISVSMIGMPVDYDRSFVVELDKEGTDAIEGVNFDYKKTVTIKAGSVGDTLHVFLYRYLDEDLVKRPVKVIFRLIENEYFRPVMLTNVALNISDGEMLEPVWWKTVYFFFGPYSQRLYLKMLEQYHELKETNPSIYDMLVEEMGENLEKMWGMPAQFSLVFRKYILAPLYDYYQENPDDKVKLPNPYPYL